MFFSLCIFCEICPLQNILTVFKALFPCELGQTMISTNVLQVEELALNSMIRRANSSVHPQVKKESKDSSKAHVKSKETEVFYFLLFSNQENMT